MRTRAVAILIENNSVALIERHRAGRHYFTFPGGGVDEGESAEQAVIREMEEETGLRVAVKQKVAQVCFRGSTQEHFLVERISGEFGTGTGEEYTDARPDDPESGVYIPIWMSLSDLPNHENIYPVDIVRLVLLSMKEGWPKEPVVIFED